MNKEIITAIALAAIPATAVGVFMHLRGNAITSVANTHINTLKDELAGLKKANHTTRKELEEYKRKGSTTPIDPESLRREEQLRNELLGTQNELSMTKSILSEQEHATQLYKDELERVLAVNNQLMTRVRDQ